MIKITKIKLNGNIVTAYAEGEHNKFKIIVDIKDWKVISVEALDGYGTNHSEKVAWKLCDLAMEYKSKMPKEYTLAWY